MAARHHSQRITKIGRPTQYTEALAKQIAEAVGDGLLLSEAASEFHIKESIVVHWTRAHPEFNDLVAHAQAVRLHEQLRKVINSRDNRDAQFWLERTQGKRFARPEVANMINMQLGEGSSVAFSMKVFEEAQNQLNAIQAVPDKPGELNPQLPAIQESPARE